MARLTSRMKQSLQRQRRRRKAEDSLLAPASALENSLKATMREFLRWCEAQHFSTATLHTRASALQIFTRWCDERSLSSPAEVTLPILERYQRHLFFHRKPGGEPLSAGTQHGRLQTLKQYFKWLVRQGVLVANPASELVLPRKPKHLPYQVLSPDEVEAVLGAVDVSTPEGLRDRAMLEVLYSTGMRRMELAALTVFSINEKLGVVAIREGKGRKDRVVPISERATAWVRKYVDEARPKLVASFDEGVLFLSLLGLRFHLTALGEVVANRLRAAGVTHGSCHLFRHSMATAMLENGADTRFIQALLGHASLESTQVYTHVAIGKLKAVHEATHPATHLLRSEEKKAATAAEANELLNALEGEAVDELGE